MTASPFASLIGPVNLSETGTYTVIATRSRWQEDDSSGRFELVVKRLEVAPLTVNETATIEINSDMQTVLSYAGGATDIYRLVGDKLEGIGGFYIEVRDPYGMVANQNFGGHQGRTVLDALSMREAGDYLIVVKREVFYNQQGQPEPAADVLRLTLTLQSVETRAVALDIPVSGTLSDENPSAYYTFTGSQGDRLRLMGSQPADDPPFSVLVVPPYGLAFIEPGTNWRQNSFVLDPLVLDLSGEYVLLIRRHEGTVEGLVPAEGEPGTTEYTITLSSSQIPILEPGVETIGTVVQELKQQLYRYDGVAGQTLHITFHSRGENFWPLMLIGSPEEVDLGRTPLMSVYSSLPTTITFGVTLPITGIYLFRVENVYGASDNLISGEFSLLVEVIE